MAKDAIEFKERVKKPEGEKRAVLRISVKKCDINRFGEALLKKEMQAKLEAYIEEKSAVGEL